MYTLMTFVAHSYELTVILYLFSLFIIRTLFYIHFLSKIPFLLPWWRIIIIEITTAHAKQIKKITSKVLVDRVCVCVWICSFVFVEIHSIDTENLSLCLFFTWKRSQNTLRQIYLPLSLAHAAHGVTFNESTLETLLVVIV